MQAQNSYNSSANMVEFYLLASISRFPLRKKEHKSYFGRNRTHDFRTSRCAGHLPDHSGDEGLSNSYLELFFVLVFSRFLFVGNILYIYSVYNIYIIYICIYYIYILYIYIRSHAFRSGRKDTNLTLVRIELTTYALLAGEQVTY